MPEIKSLWLCRESNSARPGINEVTILTELSVDINPILTKTVIKIQGGARNVISLIVHITHFYCYKSI